MFDNPRAARAKAVAALGVRKHRTETGLFLVEGPVAIAEALRFHRGGLREVWATPEGVDRAPGLATDLAAAGFEVQLASPAVLSAMADTVSPQGWLAVAKQFTTTLEAVLAAAPRLIAVMESAGDPGNVGTVIRSADAAGADAVILTTGSVDLYNPKTVRSTMGSIFHVPVVTGLDTNAVVSALHDAGVQVLAADMGGVDLPELSADGTLARPTAWVFGTEAHGLSAEARLGADRIAAIPMRGHAESMNVAMAATVCLFQSAFAQRDGLR